MSELLRTPSKNVDPVARLRGLIRRKTTEKQRFQKEMEQLDLAMGPLREAARETEVVDGEVHARALRAAAARHGIALVGPNCEGLWSVRSRVLLTFGSAARRQETAGTDIRTTFNLTTLHKAVIMTHKKIRLNLLKSIECHTHNNQQACTTKK